MSEKEQKQLKKIIKKMKRLHKKIANDGQPASRLELKALTDLGEKYAKIIEKMPLGAEWHLVKRIKPSEWVIRSVKKRLFRC